MYIIIGANLVFIDNRLVTVQIPKTISLVERFNDVSPLVFPTATARRVSDSEPYRTPSHFMVIDLNVKWTGMNRPFPSPGLLWSALVCLMMELRFTEGWRLAHNRTKNQPSLLPYSGMAGHEVTAGVGIQWRFCKFIHNGTRKIWSSIAIDIGKNLAEKSQYSTLMPNTRFPKIVE